MRRNAQSDQWKGGALKTDLLSVPGATTEVITEPQKYCVICTHRIVYTSQCEVLLRNSNMS